MKNNIQNFFFCEDLETGKIRTFDNLQLCSDFYGINRCTILSYAKAQRKYKNKYLFVKGEEHQKKVEIRIEMSKTLYDDIRTMMGANRTNDRYAEGRNNINRVCTAIIQDFLFDINNYDKNIQYNNENNI